MKSVMKPKTKVHFETQDGMSQTSHIQGQDAVVIDAPQEYLWILISNSLELCNWGPPVRRVRVLTDDGHETTGTWRRVDAEFDGKEEHFLERRIEHIEGRKMAVLIEEETFGLFKLLSEVGSSLEIEPLGTGQTRVIFTFFHNTKGGDRLLHEQTRCSAPAAAQPPCRLCFAKEVCGTHGNFKIEPMKKRVGCLCRYDKISQASRLPIQGTGKMRMTKAKYKVENKTVLDDLLLTLPGVSAGIVFGLPCYKVSASVFATLYDEGVGIKLPAARVSELLKQPNFVPFQPFGRNRGKEFVQINHDNPEDYRHDLALFEESMQYTLEATATDPSNLDNEEYRFRTIAERLMLEKSDIALGRMMSSPALQYQGKVFAFFYNNKMVFKLGRDFQPESLGIREYSLLTPFKTRPPMVDWFEIPSTEQERWEELAKYALQQMAGD